VRWLKNVADHATKLSRWLRAGRELCPVASTTLTGVGRSAGLAVLP
jgi:hypothetical protein